MGFENVIDISEVVPSSFAIVDRDVSFPTTFNAAVYDGAGEGVVAHPMKLGFEVFDSAEFITRILEVVADNRVCLIDKFSPLN
ncbi:hypothetical protein D3C71_1819450 [compost metagenome]